MVRIIHAGDRQTYIADPELVTSLIRIKRAALNKRRTHIAPRQIHIRRRALFTRQIPEWVDRLRGPVIIRAPHEQPRGVEKRIQGAENIGNRVLVGKVIAGVDHQVRLQPG